MNRPSPVGGLPDYTVDQTITACPIRNDGHDADGTPGDCMRAALATLLEQTLTEVPHVVMRLSWWHATRRHVRASRAGWDLACTRPATFPAYINGPGEGVPRYALAAGPSPRGPFSHVVVVDAFTGALAHDPHPSRAGLLSIDELYLLVGDYEPPPATPLALLA